MEPSFIETKGSRTMPQVRELVMSPKTNPVIVALQAGDDAMKTGLMGGCVSVFFLWNVQNGVFQNMRGHHGAGGVQQVNFAQLTQGVPLNAQTLMVVAYQKGETAFGLQTIRNEVAAHVTGTRRMFAEGSDVMVDRRAPHPTVSDFQDIDTSGYVVV